MLVSELGQIPPYRDVYGLFDIGQLSKWPLDTALYSKLGGIVAALGGAVVAGSCISKQYGNIVNIGLGALAGGLGIVGAMGVWDLTK